MSEIDWVSCERLVRSLASKYCSEGLDLDDLQQEARLVIWEVHSSYTPEMGISLHTFLGRRIRDALRRYVDFNLDSVEVGRKWVAEAIAENHESNIKTDSKEECEALRAVLGAERFREPKRVISKVKATVSLDDGGSDGDPDNEGSLALHERVGVPAEQETILAIGEATSRLKVVADVAAERGRRNGDGVAWKQVIELRTLGFSFSQIGERIGKSEQAAKKLWARAQKRLVA